MLVATVPSKSQIDTIFRRFHLVVLARSGNRYEVSLSVAESIARARAARLPIHPRWGQMVADVSNCTFDLARRDNQLDGSR